MIKHRQLSKTVAALAVVFILLLLLAPHAVAIDAALVPLLCLALLPLPVVAVPWEWLRLSKAPDAPILAASFQRPPPSQLA
jgi:hypothetical protein